ncbi:MAG: HDIG domain-containing protein [Fimbriimonadaceae bacterium]|nr:HDIG domain-containing protein [Fimbriimonadaceae bacterium]QYK55687.1 MAG: HDIG domain-containing protein [Fimbriimonadaceae bacterium]
MVDIVGKVADAWRGTEFEGKAYLVGGAVRDALLGRPAKADLDIVVTADALAAAELLWSRGVAAEPPVVYARFGTAMVRVEGAQVELATARRESYSPDSRKPQVEPATIEEDAARRDFTVNALFRDVFTGDLLDPLGRGLPDLESRVLRTPLDPEATFFDDPLRMLRAVRFRWQLGFAYAPGLFGALRAQASRLRVISAERIRDELVKMLALPDADRCLQDLLETGLLAEFAPEFLPTIGCEQGSYHHLDVWSHTLLALRNLGPGDLVTSLATLYHDIGKPQTQALDEEGRIRFFGHETVGAGIAHEAMLRLRFGTHVADEVALLVRSHMRLSSIGPEGMSDSAARRLVRDLGPSLGRWMDLVEADASALKKGVRRLDLSPLRQKLAEVCQATPVETLDSPLSGEEIMELTGLSPGPEVGAVKAKLVEMVLDGQLAVGDREAARKTVLGLDRNSNAEEGVASD